MPWSVERRLTKRITCTGSSFVLRRLGGNSAQGRCILGRFRKHICIWCFGPGESQECLNDSLSHRITMLICSLLVSALARDTVGTLRIPRLKSSAAAPLLLPVTEMDIQETPITCIMSERTDGSFWATRISATCGTSTKTRKRRQEARSRGAQRVCRSSSRLSWSVEGRAASVR